MASLAREENLDRLRDQKAWDVVVIGGGATGLGSAVDAASRGYRTLLLEALDFAHGTSSRSTKLIHGGVRYLAQGNFGLVREALHERGILLRNAPHLVHRRDFVVPAYALARTSLLRHRSEDLRLDVRLARPGPFALARAAPACSRGMPAIRSQGPARGNRLHRRAVRRRPAGDHPGADVCRPGRHGPQLRDRERIHQARAGGSPRSWHATPRPARNFESRPAR